MFGVFFCFVVLFKMCAHMGEVILSNTFSSPNLKHSLLLSLIAISSDTEVLGRTLAPTYFWQIGNETQQSTILQIWPLILWKGSILSTFLKLTKYLRSVYNSFPRWRLHRCFVSLGGRLLMYLLIPGRTPTQVTELWHRNSVIGQSQRWSRNNINYDAIQCNRSL